MMNRVMLISAAIFFGSCSKTPAPDWLLGKWKIAVSGEIVEVTTDSLIFNTNKRSSIFYSYQRSDSTLTLKVPESDNAYPHEMEVRIKRISSNKDTIWFTESDFKTSTFATKQK